MKEIIDDIKMELFENMKDYLIDNNDYYDDNGALEPELNLEAIYKLLDDKLGAIKF